MSDIARFRIVVGGRVQGVAFRAYTQRRAVELGLCGYVRNLDSGEVEIIAEGERTRLEKLVGFCKEGPSHARVLEFKQTELPPTGEFNSFNIRY